MSFAPETLVSLCILSCTLYLVSGSESPDEVPEFKMPEVTYVDADHNFEEHTVSTKQYKTAEIADAVMGTALPVNTPGMESLIPASGDGMTGFTVPCDEETCLSDSNQEEIDIGQKENEGLRLEMVHSGTLSAEDQNSTETAKTFKVSCDKRNITDIVDFSVQVLNASQDLMDFLHVNSTECSLVLFYTSWCQFSANLAPHFNALPRVFPTMHFLALDASHHGSLSTRFGTVAVPNILLFQGVKPMARFNHTDRTLETLTSFLVNQTGFEAVLGQMVTDEDNMGPLPSVPVRSIDWLLVFSIFFICGFTVYAILRTESVRWLIPGQDHEHQD